jgi:hypothetical protein
MGQSISRCRDIRTLASLRVAAAEGRVRGHGRRVEINQSTSTLVNAKRVRECVILSKVNDRVSC